MATIQELESFKLSDAVKFHKELNPRLWNEGKLDPEVRDQLLLIAEDFVEYLGLDNLKVEDVTISGSNAAYSYTPHSDLDLHILVDFNKLPDNPVYQELFTAKKTLYNDAHDITVRDVPVELYVQDTNQVHTSLGEYSVVHDKWIRIPKKRRANFDEVATKAKYEKLGDLIELALKSRDPKRVKDTIDLVKRYRKAGLERAGEFGPENLAFKAIRKQGLIQDLYDLKAQLHAEKLSIDEYANEDYDPNGPPPGPEFKPTMPAGTVRVDVSDVYDWYKLGQHVSNLKGLGKHDFGKGPPSTIFAFGDEDTEHKYIQDLAKTGLTTTDIDPVDPNQPKGMKRQKTDPRYNVGEGGAETSWSDGDEKITLQDILELTKHIKQINLPINDNLKSKLLHWDGNPKEIERINQVTVSTQFPILVMIDEQGQIDWILDGNHRLHKAIRSQAKTIPAKLIKPSDLSDKARRVFHIEEQSATQNRKAAVLKIQKHLNKKYGANLDLDGKLGPLTLKSINKFMPKAKKGLADEPNKTTAVQGKKVKVDEEITDLRVYRNPSPKQLYRLTQRSAHKHMRGMYHDGDTYWWDGNDAIHKQGSDYLGIPYDYQMRMEAAIDSVSDNYRVGGDDGVPQDIIQKYDIENELVYEASAISMYSDWKDLPYETLNAIVNYYYSQDDADEDYNERVLRQLGFSVQTNVSPDNYENVLVSSIKTNKKYLVPVPAAQEYCDKIYDEQYSDDDNVTPENEAAAWEEGWNAHESGKPISTNPYKTASSKWDPIEKHMWDQGWNAAREDPYLREASERHPYPYGYWIDITGEVVPVESYNGHEAVGRAIMQKYDRRTKKGKIGDSLNLFYSGAIRVVTYNYPDMEIEICEPNRKAARSMVRMLRELQPTKVYYENNCQINGPKNSGTWQEASRWVTQQATDPNYYDNLRQADLDKQINEASGYIPSEKEKNDPRFKTALTVDVKPNSIKNNAKAFNWKTSRAGIPPQARADGKLAEDLMREFKTFLSESALPKIGYHVTATKNLPIILKHGIKADKRGNSYVWDSREMAEWFMDFQNDEGQDRTILKIDMLGLDAKPDPEAEDMSEWSSRFKPGTNGGAWIISGPIPPDKIIG